MDENTKMGKIKELIFNLCFLDKLHLNTLIV